MAQKIVVDAFIQSFIGRLHKTELNEFVIETQLDLHNQRTVSIDVARTRSDVLTDEDRIELEKMLTFYCKKNNVEYKQGMNEILAPFLLLGRYGVPQYVQFVCYEMFIDMLLGTLFRDNHFRPIMGMFLISKLILLYHYPEIYLCFEKNQITPDMYMSSWFITIFASKIKNLDILYTFWHTLIQKGIHFYLSYFGIALLGYYKLQILSHPPSSLPAIFKELQIKDFEEFKTIMKSAEFLRSNMPQTAEWVLTKYEIFNLSRCELVISSLNTLHCITILPREVIKLTYPHELVCQCLSPKTCSMQNLNLILIDCRSLDSIKSGKLLNSQILCKNVNRAKIVRNEKGGDKVDSFVNKWRKARETHHFAFMDFNGRGEDWDVSCYVVRSFVDAGFAHVSVVEGGYVACHEFLVQHGLPFVQHKSRSCQVCICEDKEGCDEVRLGRAFSDAAGMK